MALLFPEEAAAFLTHMERYQYQLEGAIGCSINVHSGRSCALACFSLCEFKTMVDKDASWGPKVVDWVMQTQKAGADEAGLVIPHSTRKERQRVADRLCCPAKEQSR
ncbi:MULTISPECIES: hypothetical protein [unclassified Halomonas]|uniref:hypothetical protein n=1 Tax=unclassified Halomonas TaxID=2609666 RepID=UPI003F932B41